MRAGRRSYGSRNYRGQGPEGMVMTTLRSMAGRALAARERARRAGRLARACVYDFRRFLAYSSTRGPFRSRANLAARITERYHGLEKSLAIPDPQPRHSADVLTSLIPLLGSYLGSYGEDELTAAAIGALRAYHDFNAEQIGADEVPFGPQIRELIENHRSNPSGVSGVRRLSREEVDHAVGAVDPKFFSTRHTVRVYGSEPVTDQEVETAVAAARCAPAVCNREFSMIRIWRDRATIDRLLKIQGGTRGFGDGIPALALITVPLRSYWNAEERHQAWVDGGMVAMSFLLGLHSQSLGAVALNWSKAPERDRALRRALPDVGVDEAIIMFVGFGHLPEHLDVAASPRIMLPR